MIPFDFEYYRPESAMEAAETYRQLDEAGLSPVWYGGGTELLSMARVGAREFGAVIDIKSIPECRMLSDDGDSIVLGAALTLDDIRRSQKFPLMAKTAGRIADHTIQCKITLGGNLAATIMYREAALPLLLTDAVMSTAGLQGIKRYPVNEVFKEQLRLPKGEFIVGTSLAREFAEAAYFHIKKTKNEKIDYPVVTAAALVADNRLRIAFAGLASYPLRDLNVENILNDRSINDEERADRAAAALDGVIVSDMNGSAGYRRFVLKNTIVNILDTVNAAGLVRK